MDEHGRMHAYGQSQFFADGAEVRPRPSGAVPIGPAMDRTGDLTPPPLPPAAMPPVTLAMLTRGRAQFETYCAPCHGLGGYGDGVIVQYGFPAPPSYHIARLRKAPDSHFYDVITHGWGVMYPYASRVSPADRWAIIAYIRALQLSQNARLADVPDAQRAKLGGAR
ncbi:MAG TPA: cytochrome c [Oscillatoriaceae cyanobacterium]